MNSSHISFQAAFFSAVLAAATPAFAGDKTEDPARVARTASPALAKQAAALGPGSYLIDFEDLAVGATVSSQYSAWGVSFSANAYSGGGGPTRDWATNTGMSIAVVGGGDTGALGTPPLVSGNLLHSFSNWVAENGDPSFLLSFDKAITSISIDFAGIAKPSSTGIDLYSTTGTYLTRVLATKTGQQTLTYTGTNIGAVVVTPGDYDDWVGVDNIGYTVAAAVPEPETYGMLALGLGLIGFSVRRRQR